MLANIQRDYFMVVFWNLRGGGGTWNMFSRYGESIAAVVPLCRVRAVAAFSAPNLVNDSAANAKPKTNMYDVR